MTFLDIVKYVLPVICCQRMYRRSSFLSWFFIVCKIDENRTSWLYIEVFFRDL